MIQSVRFSMHESPPSVNRGRGWREVDARRWLQAHGLHAPRALPTRNQLRFRQADPGDFDTFKTRTAALPVGVQLLDAE